MMPSARASCPLAAEEEEVKSVAAAVEALHFLGDRNRLRILKLLAREELCVGELVDQLAPESAAYERAIEAARNQIGEHALADAVDEGRRVPA